MTTTFNVDAGKAPYSEALYIRKREKNNSNLIIFFVFFLFLPINIYLGPARLTPYRIFLIIFFVPSILNWITGRLSGIKTPDILFLLFPLWAALALSFHHGVGAMLQPMIILMIESFGAYIVARNLIRTEKEFVSFVNSLTFMLFIVLLFVAHEALSQYRFLTVVFQGDEARLGISQYERRFGMLRAQGMFEHPILLGVFASFALPLAFYTFRARKGIFSGLINALGPAGVVFFSLSMGAWLSSFFHVLIMAYDFIVAEFRKKWKVLIIGFASIYTFLSIASNRGPVGILLDNLAQNPLAAWMRVATWEYGSAAVMRSPIFGIGHRPFPRPFWVTSSVDNFWLVWALRAGVPAALAIIGGVIAVFLILGRAKYSERRFSEYRKGILISIAGVCIAISSVHIWNATFAIFFFTLGAAVWLANDQSPHPETRTVSDRRSTDARVQPRSPYGRIAV